MIKILVKLLEVSEYDSQDVLTASNVEFKVCGNHGWDISYPSNNKTLIIIYVINQGHIMGDTESQTF